MPIDDSAGEAGPPRSFRALLRATRPWWIVPLVLLLLLVIGLVLSDTAPARSLAYSVL